MQGQTGSLIIIWLPCVHLLAKFIKLLEVMRGPQVRLGERGCARVTGLLWLVALCRESAPAIMESGVELAVLPFLALGPALAGEEAVPAVGSVGVVVQMSTSSLQY